MKRSTMASIVAASPGGKKYQPSGLTGRGGSPAKGDQGSSPEMVRPSKTPGAEAARIGTAATDASRRRRLSARPSARIKVSFHEIHPSDSVLVAVILSAISQPINP